MAYLKPSIENWDVTYIGNRIYKLTHNDGTSKGFILGTGSAVGTNIRIIGSFNGFRLTRIVLKQVDTNDADAANSIVVEFQRQMDDPKTWFPEYAVTTVATEVSETFGEGYELEGNLYRIYSTVTATNKLIVEIYIQVLRG